MKLKTYIAQIPILLALLLLPLFISIQLTSAYRRNDHDFRQLVKSLNDTEVLVRLTKATSPFDERARLDSLKLIAASDFPETSAEAAKLGCIPEDPSSGPIVSRTCIASVVSGLGNALQRTQVEKLASNLHIAERLQELSPSPNLPPTAKGDQDLVLFSHVIVKTKDGEVLFIYPATHLGSNYDFRHRPWYQHVETFGPLLLSPLYHEYVYKTPVITATRFTPSKEGSLQIGVDIALPNPPPSLSIFLVNLLFAAMALYLYWRAHLSLKMSFLLPLIASTGLLSITYLLLSIGDILVMKEVQDINLPRLILGISFIPSGSFILIAARLLRRGRGSIPWNAFFLAVAVEFTCAGVGLLTGNQFLSSGFAALSLATFGVTVYRIRLRYASYSDLTPKPAILSTMVALSYILWGLCQFASPIVSFAWRDMAHIESPAVLRETILDDSTPFILLLYAKGLSIFLTVLYLSMLERIRLIRASGYNLGGQQIGVLYLAEHGVIIRHSHLPDSFPDLTDKNVMTLFADPVDQAELWHALEERRALRNYICQFGPRDDRRVVGVNLDLPEEGENVGVLLFEHSGSWEASLSGVIFPVLRHDILALITKIEGTNESTDSGESRAIIQRLRLLDTELSMIKGIADAEEALRMPAAQAFFELKERVADFNKEPSAEESSESNLPFMFARALLRISPRIYSLVLYCIFSDFQRLNAGRLIKVEATTSNSQGGYFEMTLGMAKMQALEDMGVGYDGFRGGVRPSLERTSDMQLAAYLLNLFNGRLMVTESFETSTVITILVRFLFSTIEEA